MSAATETTKEVTETKVTATKELEPFYVTYNKAKYNIASFVSKHPGGSQVFTPLRDLDMTEAFDNVGHSKAAVLLLSRYLVGADKLTDRQSIALPEGGVHYLSKKLFTPEDKYFFHKSFGFLSLASFVYRYAYMWPTTGSLGFTGTNLDYATLGLHFMLSASSLIFHVLEKRLQRNPLIIYEEYRQHAIVFTLRTVGISLLGFIPTSLVSIGVQQAALICWMLGCHLLVDDITRRHGTPGVTAVRNAKADEYRPMKLFFSYYQFLVIGACLVWSENLSDIGFNALIAIQSSSLLMTLKRKSLISWTTYAFCYGACLVLSMMYMVRVNGLVFLASVAGCFALRVQFGWDKYAIWALYAAAVVTVRNLPVPIPVMA